MCWDIVNILYLHVIEDSLISKDNYIPWISPGFLNLGAFTSKFWEALHINSSILTMCFYSIDIFYINVGIKIEFDHFEFLNMFAFINNDKHF